MTLTTRVQVSPATRASIRIDVYDPAGHLAYRKTYAARTYAAGTTVTYRPVFAISKTRRTGTYVVMIRVLDATSGALLFTKTSSRTFRVHA